MREPEWTHSGSSGTVVVFYRMIEKSKASRGFDDDQKTPLSFSLRKTFEAAHQLLSTQQTVSGTFHGFSGTRLRFLTTKTHVKEEMPTSKIPTKLFKLKRPPQNKKIIAWTPLTTLLAT